MTQIKETPKELIPAVLELLSAAKDSGKIKKGINETTKSIERKTAHLVVVAQDVTPAEIAVHIPTLCEERSIPYAYVPTRKELGAAVGIEVSTAAIAIENAGNAVEKLQDLVKKLPKHTKA